MRRDIFQAIADPTRREIIELLAVKRMTPNEVASHFETTRQAVSKHMKILVECEALKSEKYGREIHYSLNNSKLEEVDKWIEQFRLLMKTRFDQLDTVLAGLKTKPSKKKGK